MILLEIITSCIIFVIMVCMSAISTSYLSITEKDFDFSKISDGKKVKHIKYFLKNSSSYILSMKSSFAFLDLWLGALIVEIIADPIYQNISVSSEGSAYLIKYLVILFTVFAFAYFLYVFAEIIPKTYAIKNKKRIVLSTINFVYGISLVFRPISHLLKITEELILKLFKVDRKDVISYKDSEIKESIEIGKEMGILSNQESQIISRYLALDERTAKDIMIPMENVVTIDLSSSREKMKQTILNHGYTRIPVYEENPNHIIGIVNVKNVLNSLLEKKPLTAKDCIKPCMVVPSGKRLDLLFKEMKKNKEHMAIVVKEKDQAIGIVTMENIIEEIAGNIEDDYEKYKKEELGPEK